MEELSLNAREKEKWKRIAATAVFLLIIVRIFITATYLFRNVGYDRYHVIGIKEEKNLDMVYIGGSGRPRQRSGQTHGLSFWREI